MIFSWLNLTPSFSSELPNKTIRCWEIKQKNKYFGTSTIYASPKFYKFIAGGNKWVDLARAPNWDVYLIGLKNHRYYRFGSKDFKGHILITFVSTIDRHAKPVTTKREEKIAGITTEQYCAKTNKAAPLVRGELIATNYWVAKNLGLPPQIVHIFCMDMGIPDLPGLPFRMIVEPAREKSVLATDTTSARLVSLPESFFNLPSGLKRVDTPEEILTGGVNELLEDFVR